MSMFSSFFGGQNQNPEPTNSLLYETLQKILQGQQKTSETSEIQMKQSMEYLKIIIQNQEKILNLLEPTKEIQIPKEVKEIQKSNSTLVESSTILHDLISKKPENKSKISKEKLVENNSKSLFSVIKRKTPEFERFEVQKGESFLKLFWSVTEKEKIIFKVQNQFKFDQETEENHIIDYFDYKPGEEVKYVVRFNFNNQIRERSCSIIPNPLKEDSSKTTSILEMNPVSGKLNSVIVSVKDQLGNSFDSKNLSIQGFYENQTLQSTYFENGKYKIEFTPKKSKEIRIQLQGEEIHGSPLKFEMEPGDVDFSQSLIEFGDFTQHKSTNVNFHLKDFHGNEIDSERIKKNLSIEFSIYGVNESISFNENQCEAVITPKRHGKGVLKLKEGKSFKEFKVSVKCEFSVAIFAFYIPEGLENFLKEQFQKQDILLNIKCFEGIKKESLDSKFDVVLFCKFAELAPNLKDRRKELENLKQYSGLVFFQF
jgi:hypothetical protein